MSTPIPPLDDTAQLVLARGRDPIDAPAGAKERLRARLEASLPPGSTPPASGSGGAVRGAHERRVPAWSVGVAFVAGALAGFVARGSADRTPPPMHAEAQSASVPASAAALAPAPADSTPAPRASSALPVASTAPRQRSDVAPGMDHAGQRPDVRARGADLSAERAILDVARTALARGEGARAIDAAKEHERKFPRGALAEEREAIYVQALVLAGNAAEARARAQRFRQVYPDSMLLPAVQAATEDRP